MKTTRKKETAPLKSFYADNKIEAGCDEAGRGCLAGPVFAAAVILPSDYSNRTLNDSKQLTEKQRYQLRDEIIKEAISWSVQEIDNTKIDEINILRASILGMQLSVDNLYPAPELLLIDGNHFSKHKLYQHVCIIKGDSLYYSIAAASVLAKTFRDDFMIKLHEKYPMYQWNKNKGYPTKIHRMAIAKHGITEYHRKSFNLISNQLSLEF